MAAISPVITAAPLPVPGVSSPRCHRAHRPSSPCGTACLILHGKHSWDAAPAQSSAQQGEVSPTALQCHPALPAAPHRAAVGAHSSFLEMRWI